MVFDLDLQLAMESIKLNCIGQVQEFDNDTQPKPGHLNDILVLVTNQSNVQSNNNSIVFCRNHLWHSTRI